MCVSYVFVVILVVPQTGIDISIISYYQNDMYRSKTKIKSLQALGQLDTQALIS